MTPCRHSFKPSDHECYDVCERCGSFKSMVAPPPETIYTASYWTEERGHSTPEAQVYNCDTYEENGVTKNEFILSSIDVPSRERALEIGCSPNALVHRLVKDAGFLWVDGIDPIEPWTRLHFDNGVALVRTGYFPEDMRLQGGSVFDLIIASDVFEHSHEPEAFVMECARLLKDGGQLILMLPLAVDDIPERMFHPQEHVWIHSPANLNALLSVWGFTDIEQSRWCPGHEVISCHWRERPASGLRERVPDKAYDGDEVGCF